MGDGKGVEDQSRSVVSSAKTLYGSIQELGVQLDSLSSRCLEVEDLFAPDLQTKRQSVKEACDKLFNLSPKSYGAVAREKLWRFALYDAVSRARRIQRDRPWTASQLDLVRAHLIGGVGILQSHIMKLKGLCESMKDPVCMRADAVSQLLEDVPCLDFEDVITHEQREKTWITCLVHLCVVNIGDLYRYLKEMYAKSDGQDLILETCFFSSAAQSQYSKAFLLLPESGLAFNQLGNLYSDLSGSLQSAYYLLYSLQSVKAYEGAHSNLRQYLDRKIVQYARLPASVEPKPLEILVNNVLSLMYYFLYENTHLQNYERHCQEALTNFNERLLTSDPEMDQKFLFQMSTICVMTVWRLQSINSIHTSAAVAFSISVFCQLINHLSVLLDRFAKVKPIEEPVPIQESPHPSQSDLDRASDIASSKNEKNEDDMKESSENEITEQNGFIVPKRRRRVRRSQKDSDSESDMSDYDGSEDEELDNSAESEENWSEDEDEMGFGESGVDDDKASHRDGSEYSFQLDSGNKAFDSSSSNGNSEKSGRRSGLGADDDKANRTTQPPGLVDVAKEKYLIEIADLLSIRDKIETTLVALSPFLRWIQTSSVIKDALAANAEKTFLEKFCSILNLLLSQNWSATLEGGNSEGIQADWDVLCKGHMTEKDVMKWEMEEDRSMLGIPQLYDFVKDLQLGSVSPDEALVIRLGRMVAFGSWMVSTESFSVLYNAEEKNFFVPSPQTLKAYLLESKLNRLKERLGSRKSDDIDKLSRAYKEMKLKNSSSGRRNRDDSRRRRRFRGRKGPQSKDPIYAVVDLEAILRHFPDVKRVAANRKFVVVVPYSVWETLDILKDAKENDSYNARAIFRWLDAAFNRKHPGFILHKDQQKVKINFPYPKDQSDTEAWEYYDMMEHCNYLMTTLLKNNQAKPRSNEVIWGDVRDKCRVFYLTGHENLVNTKIPRTYDPVKIARNVGIYVDYIEPYPDLGRGRKWKSVAKSNG